MFQGASRHLVISKVSSSFYNLTNKTLLSVFESFDKKLEENVSGQNFFCLIWYLQVRHYVKTDDKYLKVLLSYWMLFPKIAQI